MCFHQRLWLNKEMLRRFFLECLSLNGEYDARPTNNNATNMSCDFVLYVGQFVLSSGVSQLCDVSHASFMTIEYWVGTENARLFSRHRASRKA